MQFEYSWYPFWSFSSCRPVTGSVWQTVTVCETCGFELGCFRHQPKEAQTGLSWDFNSPVLDLAYLMFRNGTWNKKLQDKNISSCMLYFHADRTHDSEIHVIVLQSWGPSRKSDLKRSIVHAKTGFQINAESSQPMRERLSRQLSSWSIKTPSKDGI